MSPSPMVEPLQVAKAHEGTLVSPAGRVLPAEFVSSHGMHDSELRLLFQPVVSLVSGKPIGAEALIRWVSVDGAVANNGLWIPEAEDLGVMRELDEAVAGAAIRCAADVQRANPAFTLAFNVSVSSVCESFVEDIIGRSAAAGVDPGGIDIEVTESFRIRNPEQLAGHLAVLREAGFGVLLDDFGTGWGTLTHLDTLPLSGVKLDRSFVDRLGEDPQSGAIATAVQTLTSLLGVKVIAEGVERGGQVRELLNMGYDAAQGWLFGRPAPMGALQLS